MGDISRDLTSCDLKQAGAAEPHSQLSTMSSECKCEGGYYCPEHDRSSYESDASSVVHLGTPTPREAAKRLLDLEATEEAPRRKKVWNTLEQFAEVIL